MPELFGRLRDLVSRHALAFLVLGGLALRLWLAWVIFPGEGFGNDLRDHVSWMGTLGRVGPAGFYDEVQRALPPVFLWLLWPLGMATEGLASATGSSPDAVARALVKLPAIAADVLIAIMLFAALRGWNGRRAGLIAAGLFLFVPVTWYESALWGQIDAIGALFVLAALVLLIGGWSEAAAVATITAALVKPQFGIVLVVVGVVLLRRHLLLPGSGPTPNASRLARVSEVMGGWFTRRQGAERLVSSLAASLLVGLAIIVPFRTARFAQGAFADVPIVGDVAGLFALVRRLGDLFPVITVNAFNPWAFAGPDPLVGSVGHWTPDSIAIIGGLSAFGLGVTLLIAASALVGLQLLLRDDRETLFLAATVLAVALFVLPTRAHERYLFPAFVVAAPLAAVSTRWRAWYLLLVAAGLANLHAVLTVPGGQYGTAAMVALPLGDVLRDPRLVGLVVVTLTALFGVAAWQTRAIFDGFTRKVRAALDERWRLRSLIPDAGTALLLVLGASALLRAIWLNVPTGALIFDEAFYVNAARVMIGIQPPAGAHYHDAVLFLDPNTEHPPLGKVLIAASMAAFGDNAIGWRVPSLVAGMVALAAVYGIVRAFGGRPWLGVLAVALYSLDTLSFIHGRIGTLDMMSVAFLLAGAWLALRERWLLAGAMLALGTLVKVPGLYGFLAVLAWQGLALWRASRRERLTWPHVAPTAALVGAYALVGLGGLWLLDLRFTAYATPLDHIQRMLSYGLALQGGFNPSGITSAPWQWLVNEGQFNYLRTVVNTLVNGEITGSRTIVEFRALLNPVLVGTSWLAILYGAWLAWKRREPLATWGLIWIGANYLPLWALALFADRITYFYYILPSVPALALLTAVLLVHGRLPRAVALGLVTASAMAFLAHFPFRVIP